MKEGNYNRSAEHGILIIDDDQAVLNSMARVFRNEGFGDPLLCADPRQALKIATGNNIAVILLDLSMPYVTGEKLLAELLAALPQLPIIIVTATNDVETAVRCVRAGAFDFLVKPVDYQRLITTVIQAGRHYALHAENTRLKNALQTTAPDNPAHFAEFIAESPAMNAMFRQIEAIAPSSEPVLIVGETGVGKELVAKALHLASGRSGSLTTVNVSGIDDNAFSDTLFGHKKGAFTGADQDRAGMIERTGTGTLFLDEIGDLGNPSQVKLLRLLQEGEYMPLGSDQLCRSRCRVIAATNQDLLTRMHQNQFRADLYYRLHGHLVRVPALREHMEDLELLINHFLKQAAEAMGKPLPTVPNELYVHLRAYHFPGNIRELRAMIFDAVARHEKGVMSLSTFNEHMMRGKSNFVGNTAGNEPIIFGNTLPTMEEANAALIEEALKRAEGNQGVAARMLNISRKTISRHCNQ